MAKEEENEIASRSPHFFRIILPQILQNQTLELPRAFVKEHGKSFSKHASLKLPTGAKSKIDLRICDDRAWFHKGWREFVNKYSIESGYFLVFKYKGGSRFNVLIFDLSTSEIDYPVPSARARKVTEVKKEDCDVKDDISDESPHKLQKGTKTLRSGRVVVAIGGKGVLERAKSFQSPNPHFAVIMGAYYITRGSLLIPIVDARRYFVGRGDNGVKLNGPDGRGWLMEYCVSGSSRRPDVRIVSRWKEFVEEYELGVGDACVFEMVDDKVLTFNVCVFRIDDEGRRRTRSQKLGIDDGGRRRTRSQKRLKFGALDV